MLDGRLTPAERREYLSRMEAVNWYWIPWETWSPYFEALVDESIAFEDLCAHPEVWWSEGERHRYSEAELRDLWQALEYQRRVLHHEIGRYMKQVEGRGPWTWPGNGRLWSGALAAAERRAS